MAVVWQEGLVQENVSIVQTWFEDECFALLINRWFDKTKNMITTQMQRWGILGTGMIARKFAEELNSSHPGSLAWVGSRRPESAQSFAEDFTISGCGTYDEVLQDASVDFIYIALPNGMHHEWSIKAMEAGKHVLCEKPIAANHREAREMFAVAEQTQRTLVEAFMYRTHPVIEQIIEQVRSGEIGEVRLMRANFSFARDVDPSDARYHPGQAGGSLMDVGCYCVNFCRAITGQPPSDVTAMAHIHATGVDDYAAGVMKFGETTLATFTCGMTVKNDWSTFIAGTAGQIRIDNPWFPDGKYTITRPQGVKQMEYKTEMGPYSREAVAFSNAVSGVNPPWISPEDTLGNMETLDLLRHKAGIQFPK